MGVNMRIAFLTQRFPCMSNTFILNQITGLIERGHEIDIFGQRVGDASKVHADFHKYNLSKRMQHIPVPENYLYRALKAAFLLSKPYAWHKATFNSLNIVKYGIRIASLTQLYTTLSLLKEKPYDIVHCQFGYFGIAALPLLQERVITGKLVASFRGSDISWRPRPLWVAKSHNRATYFRGPDVPEGDVSPGTYDHLFKLGHLFLPVSQLFKTKLIKGGCPENKIRVHHSGISCDRFVFTNRYRDTNEETKILFIGRLVEKKGLIYALQAIVRVLKSGRRVSFTIVGDGPLRKKINQFIETQGIQNSTRILGEQPQEKVINYLSNSHILVAPSVTVANSDNQEGIPNVIKEAMATGMPVVSTIHSGIPELVDDGICGFLVPEWDLDALVDRLIYLIDHPEIWPIMGKAGRNKIESEFNINKLNDELVSLYQNLLKRSG
jgi:colanic acid/amylovoran biosynthesis glycosyltransferase